MRIAADTSAGSASSSGSARNTAANVSETSSPMKARFPVNISYNTAPKAQTSVLLSTFLPFACSGLM